MPACSALPRALNAASAMWWLFSPVRVSTWRLIRACAARAVEELPQQREVERPARGCGKPTRQARRGPAADVDGHLGERLVHGDDRVAEPRNRPASRGRRRRPGPARGPCPPRGGGDPRRCRPVPASGRPNLPWNAMLVRRWSKNGSPVPIPASSAESGSRVEGDVGLARRARDLRFSGFHSMSAFLRGVTLRV